MTDGANRDYAAPYHRPFPPTEEGAPASREVALQAIREMRAELNANRPTAADWGRLTTLVGRLAMERPELAPRMQTDLLALEHYVDHGTPQAVAVQVGQLVAEYERELTA